MRRFSNYLGYKKRFLGIKKLKENGHDLIYDHGHSRFSIESQKIPDIIEKSLICCELRGVQFITQSLNDF